MTEQERRVQIEALLQRARTLYDQNHQGRVTAVTEELITLTIEGESQYWTRAKVAVVLMDVYTGLHNAQVVSPSDDDLIPWFTFIETLFTELQSAMSALTKQESPEESYLTERELYLGQHFFPQEYHTRKE